MRRLDMLRKRAVKVAMGLPQRTPSRLIYEIFQIIPIEKEREMQIVRLLYPALSTLPRLSHGVNTRQFSARLLSRPKFRLVSTHKVALGRFVDIYNGLPDDMRVLLNNQHVVSDSYIKYRIKDYFIRK